MSESDDRYQSSDEKEHVADDKDVEGHGYTGQADRAADSETDEADVEGHGFVPPQTSPQTEP
jgi:hypothetical protein